MKDITKILKEELSPLQRKAVLDRGKEVSCMACAGSGKSRTLAYRIACLVAEDEPPESIVAFTFTEKAAETIKRRVSTALSKVNIDPTIMGNIYIGTIHSYCQRILMMMDAVYRQFDVLDENRFILYLISRRKKLNLTALELRVNSEYKYFRTIKETVDAWNTANDELVSFEEISTYDPVLGEVLLNLRINLETDQYIDFSLMIRKVVDALRDNDEKAIEAISSLKHLMVDEYQDVNPSQEELIRLMHKHSMTLFVVGDDDQSIYAWRGADVSKILRFTDHYPNASRHILSVNYRSTTPIVETSDHFAALELGPSRIPKDPVANKNKSPQDFRVLWFKDRKTEASWVADRIKALLGTTYMEDDGSVRGLTPADFAILMRSTREPERNDSPRHSAFTSALTDRDIKYSLEAGGGPFERPQVAVLRSTFELLREWPLREETARLHFLNEILPAYPHTDLEALKRVLTKWGREIHTPLGGARSRVYPQQLVYDLLEAFGLSQTEFDEETMRDIGLFSRMLQDVETVYMSVDSRHRFQEILNFLSNSAETGYDVSTEEVIKRPDAVTVSTVHKMKGLEFPCVFVVDVENQRFPRRNERYKGWLPNEVIKHALKRGAYQSTDNEEARLFYTALTRAERYVNVTGSEKLPGGTRRRIKSRYMNQLQHTTISFDPNGLPSNLTQSTPRRRIEDSDLPTSFSQLRYYLRCPMDYRFRQSFGFSPSVPLTIGFGNTVHTTVEKLHEVYKNTPPNSDEATEMTGSVFHLKHAPQSNDPVNNPGPYEYARNSAVEIVRDYITSYSSDFKRLRQVEAAFDIPANNCVISGSIDLLLKEDPQGGILEAEVIDFKTLESSEELDWAELSLQIQLYARAAKQLLGENAKTGHVHLLKANERITVPVTDDAIGAALANIEWAVSGILNSDFPMRPHPQKCDKCDFRVICKREPQEFLERANQPPRIYLPGGREMIRAFSLYQG